MRASKATSVVGLAAGLLALASGGIGGRAAAQDSTGTTISVVAGVPGESLDAVVDGHPLDGGLAFGDVSDPVAVEPGRHQVMLGPRGGADESPDRIDVQLDEGDQVTVARFLDRTGEPQVDSFPEDRSPVPAGRARLVVRHLAELPEADVRLNGTPVATELRSGRDAAATVQPGPGRLDVALAGSDETLFGPADVDLAPGSVTVVSVIGSAQDDDLEAVVQHVTPEPAPSTAPQHVTVVQALLGTEVDVWVDGQRQVAGLDATRLAAGLELPVGRHQFAFRVAGDDPDSPPLAVHDVDVEADVASSVVVHLDADGKPTVSAFEDPIAGAAEPGAALLTVRHVGLGGPIDVRFGQQDVATGLAPGDEGSAEVPAGSGTVDVRFAGGARIAPVEVSLSEGSSSVVYVAGSPEDGSATVLVQAAERGAPAPRTVPTGTPDVPGAATPLLWLAAAVALVGPHAPARLRALLPRR
jgi:hypothetical protein